MILCTVRPLELQGCILDHSHRTSRQQFFDWWATVIDETNSACNCLEVFAPTVVGERELLIRATLSFPGFLKDSYWVLSKVRCVHPHVGKKPPSFRDWDSHCFKFCGTSFVMLYFANSHWHLAKFPSSHLPRQKISWNMWCLKSCWDIIWFRLMLNWFMSCKGGRHGATDAGQWRGAW